MVLGTRETTQTARAKSVHNYQFYQYERQKLVPRVTKLMLPDCRVLVFVGMPLRDGSRYQLAANRLFAKCITEDRDGGKDRIWRQQ